MHHHAACIKAWCNLLVVEELLTDSPMRKVKMPKVELRILPAFSPQDIGALLTAAEKDPRDTAIILCLLDSGCRAGEFCALDVGDVDMQTGAVMVRHSKTRRDRVTRIGARARRALLRYLAERSDTGPDQPLWVRKPTAIRELPLGERPVQRLVWYGPGALSLAELLTVIAGFADLETALHLLTEHGGINGLAQKSLTDLAQMKGIGETKPAQVKAAFELGRRLLTAAPIDRPTVKSPADAANLLMLEMGTLEQEHLRTVILDTKNHVLKIHTVYVGSLNTAMVRVGELFKEPIRMNAAAIICCHNHPSGDVTPSAEDVMVTRQIVEAGKLLSIDVLDHLVLGQGKWVSLKERNLGF